MILNVSPVICDVMPLVSVPRVCSSLVTVKQAGLNLTTVSLSLLVLLYISLSLTLPGAHLNFHFSAA